MKPFLKDMAEIGPAFGAGKWQGFDLSGTDQALDGYRLENWNRTVPTWLPEFGFQSNGRPKVLQAFMHVVITSNCAMPITLRMVGQSKRS